MLQMLVEVRAEGKCEKYVFLILAYACKEDLKQVVEDGMLIRNRNRNFIQSVELVCLQLLCIALISLSNYSFILMCYFTSGHGHPEHDLPAPSVSDFAEGCREVAALRLIGRFLTQGAEHFLS